MHKEILREYPADLLADSERLAAWLTELAEEYAGSLHIRVIDLQSGLGLWKAVRHWARHTPAFIVNSRKRYAGWDRAALDAILREVMESSA